MIDSEFASSGASSSSYSAQFSQRKDVSRRLSLRLLKNPRESKESSPSPSRPRPQRKAKRPSKVLEEEEEEVLEPRPLRRAATSIGESKSAAYAKRIALAAERRRVSQQERLQEVSKNHVECADGVELKERLLRHQGNERRLQDVNRRLQERLIVFQQQNTKNVQLARRRIAKLENELRIVRGKLEQSAKQQIQQLSPVPQVVTKRKDICTKNSKRRKFELKVRVFRGWACAVLLEKICRGARARRLKTLQRKSLSSWKIFTENKQWIRMQEGLADEYYLSTILLRQILRSWKLFTEDSKSWRRSILFWSFSTWASNVRYTSG